MWRRHVNIVADRYVDLISLYILGASVWYRLEQTKCETGQNVLNVGRVNCETLFKHKAFQNAELTDGARQCERLYGWPVSPSDCLLPGSWLIKAEPRVELSRRTTAGLIRLIYCPSSSPFVTKPRHLSNDNERLVFWFGGARCVQCFAAQRPQNI